MTRRYWCHVVIVLLASGLVACGGNDSASEVEDGGLRDSGVRDGGGDASTEPNNGVENYLPPTWMPAPASRLFILGDSVSAGWVASRVSLQFGSLLAANDDTEWPLMVNRDLEAQAGAPLAVINAAVAGAVTEDVLVGQLPGLAAGAPYSGHTVVVMTIGGNDMAEFVDSNDISTIINGIDEETVRIAENVGRVHDWFTVERFPDGISFVVATVFDPSDGTASGGVDGQVCADQPALAPFLNQVAEDARDQFLAVAADRGFAVADAYGHFLGHGYDFDNPSNAHHDAEDPSQWFGDCVHPNDRGHHEMRRLMYSLFDADFEL